MRGRKRIGRLAFDAWLAWTAHADMPSFSSMHTPSIHALIAAILFSLTSGEAPAATAIFLGGGGNYGGTIDAPDAGDPNNSGIATVVLLDTGKATAQLVWQSLTYRFKGSFEPGATATEGALAKTLRKKGVDGVELVLTFALHTDTRTIDGTLAERPVGGSPTLTTTFTLSGEVPDPALSAQLAPGIRTSFIDPISGGAGAPIPGDGFSVISLGSTAKRSGRFVGRLPDFEAAFSAGSPLRKATYAVRSGIYKRTAARPPGGQLLGRATVGDSGGSVADMLAELRWHKNQNATTTAYPNAFDNRVFLDAREYPSGQRLAPIGLQNIRNNATIRFRDGNVGADISVPFTMNFLGAFFQAPNGNRIKVSMNPRAGRFSGTFTHPGTGERTRFAGALQAAFGVVPGDGRGSFLSRNRNDASQSRSGSVRITVNQ